MEEWFIIERIPLNTTLLGLLAKEGKPLSLADIYRKIKGYKSKPTVYRHLQALVNEGLISQNDETYILAHGVEASVTAADLARINDLMPISSHFQKGFKFTVYGSKDCQADFQDIQITNAAKEVIANCLTHIDSRLANVFKTTGLSDEAIKKLIGLKIVVVASFDGTDFSVFTENDKHLMPQKRKDALKILMKCKGLTLKELGEKLELNTVQVRQIVDPIIESGFADMDEGGRIRMVQDLRTHG